MRTTGSNRRRQPIADQASGASDVEEAVRTASRDALIDAWRRRYGRSPPPGISRQLLAHAAAWQMQAERYGGLTPAARRQLRRLGVGSGEGTVRNKPPRQDLRPTLMPTLGTRLVRDWRGRTHTVDVTAAGFLYEGRQYRSLSAVARAITGARWSGPRFFGIR